VNWKGERCSGARELIAAVITKFFDSVDILALIENELIIPINGWKLSF
jgi:hypothetical protein